MKTMIDIVLNHLILAVFALALPACHQGSTRPDHNREAPQTIEAEVGARKYTCIKLPDEVRPGRTAPVYKCS